MPDEPNWLRLAQQVLHEALPQAKSGLKVESGAKADGPARPDLELHLGNRHVLVEVKSATASRVSEVLGMLARAVLELQRNRRGSSDVLVAIVGLRSFGGRVEAEVRRFLALNAPEVGWGLLDDRGSAVLEIPPLEIRWRRDPDVRPEGAAWSSRVERSLFTDLNRWMLKILLLRNAPQELWGGPRDIPRHPTELAKVAGVSTEKAHRFMLAFENEGFLKRAPEGLRLVRVRNLLTAWLQQEKGESFRTVDARSLLPAGRSDEPPLPAGAKEWAVLGGSLAAKRRRLLHSSGPLVPLVHVKVPIPDAIDAGRLEIADPRDAAMRLRRPRYPESVFRGAVARGEKLALVDVWQLALDAVTDGSRGTEQADYILGRVLEIQEGT